MADLPLDLRIKSALAAWRDKPYHGEPERALITDFDLRFEDYPNQ